MNKKTTIAMFVSVMLASSSAMAISDNTITFQGEVTDETCSVAINGNGATPVILLPTVSTKDAVINLTNGFTGNGDLKLAAGASEASATYTAQYYATAAATAGTVEATLQYAVSYQ